MARTRVLFVAEAVTLAQVVRLLCLARSLDRARFEVHFAAARFDDIAFGADELRRWTIRSLAPAEVERAVARGKRIYDERTLAGYIEEERRLFADVRPSLVVGDLRLSLAVSAPLAGVPHAALINAYWSPYAVRDAWPLPDHPIVRVLGETMAARYFPMALPKVFDHFARPVNDLRKRHGLPALGSLPEVLTHGDHTLFPDIPALVPTAGAPAHHHYLGPVLWAPDVPLPAWWDRLDTERPTAYVTLGSSGRADLLPLVLEGLAAAGVQTILSTAGRPAPGQLPAHTFAAPYLPGHLAAQRARFVVSNGGSTTGYQALAEGRPVLGVPFNMDQYLAMTAIERAGAGLSVRSGSATVEKVRGAAAALLDEPRFTTAAGGLAAAFGQWDAAARFRQLVDEWLAGSGAS